MKQKKACFILYIFSLLSFSIACKKDKTYLNGNIYIVNDINITDSIKGQKLDFEGIYFGVPTICDSIVLFFHPRLPDYQYYCFNIKTGKHIANFFPIGGGPEEFYSVTPIIQKYEEDGYIKSFFTAINEEKAGVFNITKSIEEKKTVLDTLFAFRWRDKSLNPFLFVFQEDDNRVLAKQSAAKITQEGYNYSLPQFLRINIQENEIERKFDIFIHPINNKKAKDYNKEFYQTYDIIKPDKSKIVMCMAMLAQINILDIETGKIEGFRISGTPNFDYLKGEIEDLKQFYCHMAADDEFIYALYLDKKYIEMKESANARIVHVFDWEGNIIRKLYLDNPVDVIDIDTENNLLYGFNFATEEFFQFSL